MGPLGWFDESPDDSWGPRGRGPKKVERVAKPQRRSFKGELEGTMSKAAIAGQQAGSDKERFASDREAAQTDKDWGSSIQVADF